MKTLILASLLAFAAPLAAADAAPDLLLDGMRLPAKHAQFTPKEGYLHALVDLFPLKDAIKGDAAKLKRVAQAVADGPALLAQPDAKAIKLALVEFPEKDSYGEPQWSSVKILARYNGTRQGKGFKLALEAPKKPKKSKP